MNPQLSKTQLSETDLPGTHLSEEAVNDLLIGAATAEAEAHLGACEHCRERVAAFHSDLDLFNQSSLALAKSKSEPEAMTEAISAAAVKASHEANHEASRARELSQPKSGFFTWRPLTAATAALLLAAGALWNHQHLSDISGQTGSTQIASPEFVDNPDQIAEDNQLLNNVYNALDEEPNSPDSEFSLSLGDNSSRTSTKARTQ